MKTKTKRELARDIAAGSVGLALAGAYWIGASHIRASTLIGKGVGADALPRALAIALCILCLLLIAQSLWAWPAARRVERSAEERKDQRRGHLRAGAMLLIGIGFLLALNELGYIPTVFLLVCATATFNGKPLSTRVLLFAALITVAFYLLFDKLLGIPMPAGFWPEAWHWVVG